MSQLSFPASCPERDLLEAGALSSLSGEEQTRLDEHVSSCQACREEYASISNVVAHFPAWPSAGVKPDSSLWSRLAQKIGVEGWAAAERELPLEPQWSDAEWQQPAPGIYCKVLSTDAAAKRVSMLVRLDPGVEYPPHVHAGIEELHLLDGELWIDDRKLYPGDYNRAEPGTADQRVWSETGCTCVLMTSTDDVLR